MEKRKKKRMEKLMLTCCNPDANNTTKYKSKAHYGISKPPFAANIHTHTHLIIALLSPLYAVLKTNAAYGVFKYTCT